MKLSKCPVWGTRSAPQASIKKRKPRRRHPHAAPPKAKSLTAPETSARSPPHCWPKVGQPPVASCFMCILSRDETGAGTSSLSAGQAIEEPKLSLASVPGTSPERRHMYSNPKKFGINILRLDTLGDPLFWSKKTPKSSKREPFSGKNSGVFSSGDLEFVCTNVILLSPTVHDVKTAVHMRSQNLPATRAWTLQGACWL